MTAVVSLAAVVPVNAQESQAANTGSATITLPVGFSPDPASHSLVITNSLTETIIANNCSGYFDPADAALVVHYAGSDRLGIFADAMNDTALIVRAPDGTLYCNEDSTQLRYGNPGVEISPAPVGDYLVMVGKQASSGKSDEVTVLVTEYSATMWGNLNANASLDNLLHNMVNSGIDFGDDSGEYANDGECDDPRFTGDGMAMFPTAGHILHDASDCSVLFGLGDIEMADISEY